MALFEITGKVVAVNDYQTFASGFTKRDIVINTSTNPSFDSPVPFSFKTAKAALLDGVKPGDEVKVKFTIDGRKWDGPNGVKFFTDLTARSIKVVQSSSACAPSDATQYEATGKGALKAYVDNGWKKEDFAAFAQRVTGKKESKSFTAADWALVIASSKAPDAAPTDPDDLPF